MSRIKWALSALIATIMVFSFCSPAQAAPAAPTDPSVSAVFGPPPPDSDGGTLPECKGGAQTRLVGGVETPLPRGVFGKTIRVPLQYECNEGTWATGTAFWELRAVSNTGKNVLIGTLTLSLWNMKGGQLHDEGTIAGYCAPSTIPGEVWSLILSWPPAAVVIMGGGGKTIEVIGAGTEHIETGLTCTPMGLFYHHPKEV